jgi:hypothetical protein
MEISLLYIYSASSQRLFNPHFDHWTRFVEKDVKSRIFECIHRNGDFPHKTGVVKQNWSAGRIARSFQNIGKSQIFDPSLDRGLATPDTNQNPKTNFIILTIQMLIHICHTRILVVSLNMIVISNQICIILLNMIIVSHSSSNRKPNINAKSYIITPL